MSPSEPGLLRHVAACNNARLPGRRAPFHVDGQPVGWLLPDAMAVVGTDVSGAELPEAGRALADAGLCRWRDEAFDVRAEPRGPALGAIDRGALPVLGVAALGVHLNGLVHRADGWHVWVGRRAMDKKLDPGKLDNMVGGGVPAGLGPDETLVKEAAEEAGLPRWLVSQAVPHGVIGYVMERPEGLRRDRLHCYDLLMPEHVAPCPVDGEVSGFELWPATAVLDSVRHADDFKFNVNLVLIDLFLRLGLVSDPALEAALQPERLGSAQARQRP